MLRIGPVEENSNRLKHEFENLNEISRQQKMARLNISRRKDKKFNRKRRNACWNGRKAKQFAYQNFISTNKIKLEEFYLHFMYHFMHFILHFHSYKWQISQICLKQERNGEIIQQSPCQKICNNHVLYPLFQFYFSENFTASNYLKFQMNMFQILVYSNQYSETNTRKFAFRSLNFTGILIVFEILFFTLSLLQ